MKEKKFISLVVYLHDAAPYLKYFLDTVLPLCENNFEQFELVCVDDACMDGTVDLLKEYVEGRQVKAMVSVVHMSFFQGLESAMNAGGILLSAILCMSLMIFSWTMSLM